MEMDAQPKIDLRVQVDRLCYLNLQPRFNLVVFLVLTSRQSITLIRNALENPNGLKQILASHCLECHDVESGQRIPVFDNELASTTKPETSCPELMTLEPERSNYMTFTNATSPRSYEFFFDSSGLRPDRTYAIKCKPSPVGWWSYESQEGIRQYFEANGHLPPAKEPPSQCVSNGDAVTFRTHNETAPAPKISVSLSAPTSMSLSGNPKFDFTLAFTSHATRPITVLAERDLATIGNTDLEILEKTSEKRVAPDLIDTSNTEGSWLREDFLRLEPEMPHVEHRSLNPTHQHSGLEDLKVHTEYVLRIIDIEWRWWSVDDIDTVLGYAGERGSGRLGPAQSLRLVCDKEVPFLAIP